MAWWVEDLHSFAESLAPLSAKTLLPSLSVFTFGYVLPILEALVGAAVLFGLQTRRALQVGFILMIVLMFGSSLRKDRSTVGIPLTYAVVYCVLIGLRFNRIGIDPLLDSFQEESVASWTVVLNINTNS